jgi:hypothetical protein
MDLSSSEPNKLDLHMHLAVDHVKGQSVGIGVVLLAKCTTTGVLMPELLSPKDRRFGVKSTCLSPDDDKTRRRAETLALMHALVTASSTIKNSCSPSVQIQQITILTEHTKTLHTIEYYLRHISDSLEHIVDQNEFAMTMRVVKAVENLKRQAIEVSLKVANMEDDAQKKAGWIAKLGGRAVRREHRRWQRARERAMATSHRTLRNEPVPGTDANNVGDLSSQMQACNIGDSDTNMLS